MEEEEENMSPPFWTENGGSDRRGRLRRSYSVFLGSSAVAICIVVIALAFTLVIIPTLHSFATNIFKPNSVNKSWDSLNLVLILFAILCGFLNKNTNDNFSDTTQDHGDDVDDDEYEKENIPTSTTWYDESYRTPYKPYNRLRSFNSYPDLRQESPWLDADERWRFYDDTHVNGYHGFDLEREEGEEGESVVKNVQVVEKEVLLPPPLIPVSPPPAERRSGENKNKRTSATKELLTSLKGKKKRQGHESVEKNVKSSGNSEPTSSYPQHSSVFHDMFASKKREKKKLNSVSSMRVSKTEQVHEGVAKTTLDSGASKKKEGFYGLEENVVFTGNESPLNTIPPPPPPPPFNLPAWKFRVQGDFVRIDSISSSSSDSSDLEDEVVESPRSEEDEILLVYSSPDVDTKAGNFIERFKAGLRMEEKQGIGASNLRPSSKLKLGPS